MRTRILLFCKYPIAGQVKTRLIPHLGAEGAANLQRELLLRITTEIGTVIKNEPGVEAEMRYSGAPKEQFKALIGSEFSYQPQGEGDLGARMSRSLDHAFHDGMQRALVVGADIPLLDATIMTQALSMLNSSDAVIGPAQDGGYYLIGMRKAIPQLFQNISWGTDKVLQQTLQRCTELGITMSQLTQLYDIDHPEDLARWKSAGYS